MSRICTEVIDDVCEQGEVDLVETIAEPFPLLVICDMLGVPRSEFDTVLRATNVILGAGDSEVLGGRDDVYAALLEAGMELTALMTDVAEHRRQHPADDLTSALVHADVGEDWLAPEELAPFFILLTTAGNDTTRNAISHGVHLLAQWPQQKADWRADLDGITPSAVEELLRMASPVTFMRRTVTRDLSLSGWDFKEGDKLVMFYGAANRDPQGVRRIQRRSTCAATPTLISALAVPGPISASAPTWPAGSCRYCSGSCSLACPTWS